ncbi:hypothetical protein AMS62_23455 [Bacillus sp. FJAT-18019]|nr:hypothetical protein AMS62_23455 [Bacillus sp. FJAT-18019]
MPFPMKSSGLGVHISRKPDVMVYLDRSEHEGERLMHRSIFLKYDPAMADLLWVQQRAVHPGYHPNNKQRDFE